MQNRSKGAAAGRLASTIRLNNFLMKVSDENSMEIPPRQTCLINGILFILLTVLMFVPQQPLYAGTITTLTSAPIAGQLAPAGGLAAGGTFVADANKLSEVTLSIWAQDGTIGRAVVLPTNYGVPTSPPLWLGPDFIYPPFDAPLRSDYTRELTFSPNIGLVPGDTYFVGIDYGLIGAVQPQIIYVGVAVGDPIPGGQGWGYISSIYGSGWYTLGMYGTDIAARIVMTNAEPTALEAAQLLVGNVEKLLEMGELNQNQADGLMDKLDVVIASLEEGNVPVACNQFGAFINQVNAFIKAGRLSIEEGQVLIDKAEYIQNKIGC